MPGCHVSETSMRQVLRCEDAIALRILTFEKKATLGTTDDLPTCNCEFIGTNIRSKSDFRSSPQPRLP